MTISNKADERFASWINQPYLDLSISQKGPLRLNRVESDYEYLANNQAPEHRMAQIIPQPFRESLVSETGLWQYHVNNPLELAENLRTNRWQLLCDKLNDYSQLNSKEQSRVIDMVATLAFHEVTREYVPEFSEKELAEDRAKAEMAYNRAISGFSLFLDYQIDYTEKELQKVAEHAPKNSIVRFNALISLIGETAAMVERIEPLESSVKVAYEELQQAKDLLGPFSYNLFMSRFYRGAGFLPMKKKDYPQMVEYMEKAEEYAKNIPHETKEQALMVEENFIPLYESRSKEALLIEDVDLAEKFVRKALDIDPYEIRTYVELGEILIRQEQFEEAAEVYRSGARMGPPGSPIAWFMAGQCHEKLEQWGLAADCYMLSSKADPLGISSLEQLSLVSKKIKYGHVYQEWLNERLKVLSDQD